MLRATFCNAMKTFPTFAKSGHLDAWVIITTQLGYGN